MGLGDLVARDAQEFVQLVVRLLENDTFHTEQVKLISDHYPNLHQNMAVADEWVKFILRVTSA
jgi:hypothetical protein